MAVATKGGKKRNVLKLRKCFADRRGERSGNTLKSHDACGDQGEKKKICVATTQWLWRPRWGLKSMLKPCHCYGDQGRRIQGNVVKLRNGCGDQCGEKKTPCWNRATVEATRGVDERNALKLRKGCGDGGEGGEGRGRNQKCVETTQWLWRPRRANKKSSEKPLTILKNNFQQWKALDKAGIAP